MKLKKVLTLALSALMLTALLTACGGQPAANSQQPSPSVAGNNTESKSYQFWGTYEASGENASMLSAAFLLNLNDDGTAVVDKYLFANFDASDSATNTSFISNYMSGSWEETEKDSVACLQIELAYVDEAGNKSNAQSTYSYDVAGVYSFDLTFPVVPGMSYTRIVHMEGKTGKTYTNANDFIQAYKQEFTAPDNVGFFIDSGNNGTAYLQANGTVLLYAGYDKFAEGTWSLGDNAIAITVKDKEVEVTMDGNQATFSIDRDMGDGSKVSYTFVYDDISNLPVPEDSQTLAESQKSVAEEGIASYEANGLVLILLDETNMKVKFPEYNMERDGFTYVLEDDTLTVTAPGEDVLGAFGQVWASMGGEKWTLDGNTAVKAK